MPATSVEPIDVLGVELIGAFQGIGQRTFAARRYDKMDVIGHQAIAVHRQLETLCSLSQEGQEHPPVVVYEEGVLAVITPLSNVMSTTCNDNSRTSRHNDKLADQELDVN